MRSFFISCLSVAVRVFLFFCYEFTPALYPLLRFNTLFVFERYFRSE